MLTEQLVTMPSYITQRQHPMEPAETNTSRRKELPIVSHKGIDTQAKIRSALRPHTCSVTISGVNL